MLLRKEFLLLPSLDQDHGADDCDLDFTTKFTQSPRPLGLLFVYDASSESFVCLSAGGHDGHSISLGKCVTLTGTTTRVMQSVLLIII